LRNLSVEEVSFIILKDTSVSGIGEPFLSLTKAITLVFAPGAKH
jgi:hypothetical protein